MEIKRVKRLGNLFGYIGASFSGNVYDVNSLSPTLNTMQGGNKQPMIIEEPKIIREPPLERDGWHRNAKEVLNVNGLCRTLNTQSNNLCTKIKEEPSFRIRKLTPKECYRLMGFDDESFERAEQVNSNTQLYKQAGNSIVVDVLMAIFDNLLISGCSVWLDELLKNEDEEES